MASKRQRLLTTIVLILLLIRKRLSIRTRHYLTRSALVEPSKSPWRRLYQSKSDKSLLNTTGLTFDAFHLLLRRIEPYLPDLSRRKTGRRRGMHAVDVLGLVLHWLNSTMRQKTLAQLFGITPSGVSAYLKVGLAALERGLSMAWECQVRWPQGDEFKQYATLINNREPYLTHSFGFVDGLNLPIQEPRDPDKQNAYYNGWLGGCFASNVLVFLPNGKICFAAINRPGSWHDSAVASHLYQTLIQRTPPPFNILADSAFPSSHELKGKIFAVLKDTTLGAAKSRREYGQMLLYNNAVKGQRQSAEWGMRSIQGAFGRLKLPLPEDDVKRARIIKTCVFLHNFRAEHVGQNQIRTVYWEDDSRVVGQYDL